MSHPRLIILIDQIVLPEDYHFSWLTFFDNFLLANINKFIISIGIVRIECGVLPPNNNIDAILLEEIFKTINPLDLTATYIQITITGRKKNILHGLIIYTPLFSSEHQ